MAYPKWKVNLSTSLVRPNGENQRKPLRQRPDLSLNLGWAALDDVSQAMEPFRAAVWASESPENADLPKKQAAAKNACVGHDLSHLSRWLAALVHKLGQGGWGKPGAAGGLGAGCEWYLSPIVAVGLVLLKN